MSWRPFGRVRRLAVTGWEEAADRLRKAVLTFRESSLYAQAVITAILVAVSALAAALPVGPLAPVRHAFAWVVTHDYDFADRALQAKAWARERGGWAAAAKDVWGAGYERVQRWGSLPNAAMLGGRPAGAAQTGAEPMPLYPRPAEAPAIPVDGALLSGFGWSAEGPGDHFHTGIDLMAPAGAAVVAAADGIVLSVYYDSQRGNVVEILHGSVVGAYAQVEAIRVQPRQPVVRGQLLSVIAQAIGDERSLPPHLHFEILTATDRIPVDPASFLRIGGKRL